MFSLVSGTIKTYSKMIATINIFLLQMFLVFKSEYITQHNVHLILKKFASYVIMMMINEKCIQKINGSLCFLKIDSLNLKELF